MFASCLWQGDYSVFWPAHLLFIRSLPTDTGAVANGAAVFMWKFLPGLTCSFLLGLHPHRVSESCSNCMVNLLRSCPSVSRVAEAFSIPPHLRQYVSVLVSGICADTCYCLSVLF